MSDLLPAEQLSTPLPYSRPHTVLPTPPTVYPSPSHQYQPHDFIGTSPPDVKQPNTFGFTIPIPMASLFLMEEEEIFKNIVMRLHALNWILCSALKLTLAPHSPKSKQCYTIPGRITFLFIACFSQGVLFHPHQHLSQAVP